MTNYTWEVIGGTLDSGQYTDTIYYTAGIGPTVTIKLRVTSTVGGCPAVALCQKVVDVSDLPDCTITADIGVCAYSEGNNANTTSGYAGYSWSIVSGPATITSGSNTSAIKWNAGDAGTANFSVTVTDSNGCTATCYKEVTVYELPDCTITADPGVCAESTGNSANTTSGYASYSWSVVSGPATITSGSNTSAIKWNAGDAGTANFSVTVTDSNGCTATCYKEVTVYELPDCTITADPGVCAESTGNSANTTSGYASYSWKVVSGPATITSGSNTSAITWNAGDAGTANFSVTVTDSNGCTATCYKEVAVYELPDCTITADPGVCAESTGNSANTTSGYATYSWKVVSGPATITSGSNTSAITWNAGDAGTANFSVTVTDSNGCSDKCYKEVTVYDLPDCTITADPGVCAESTGNSANTTSGYATYSWSVVSGPATITSGSNTSAITWNAGDAGTANFSVTVTDGNGCTATCYKEVAVYELPDCTITADPGVCAESTGNSANTTSGYASYSWKVVSGPATITSGSNTSAITWNAGDAGTANFSVTVTDSNGCTATCYKEVAVYELPDCTITADPGVCAESTGNSANTTSGYASYSWKVVSGPAAITSGSNTSVITWNAGDAGTANFSVTVTDSNGCTATCYKEVAVYRLPDCTITADPGVCADSTGNSANTTSGYATYSWKVVSGPAAITSGSNTSAITWNAGDVGTANFSVTVTDSNGCTATCYKEVAVYDLPDCAITADPGVCAESTGNSANTTSGYASYSWKVVSGPAAITSGSNTSAITWNAGDAGTANFSVTVTDSNGCTATCYKEVAVYELPDCTITADPGVCADSTGNSANTTSGYASYSWKVVSGPATITSGSNTSAITWNAGDAGTANFSVTVTDSNGCTATCYKEVAVYELPDCTITADPGVCADSTGNSANTTSGYPTYSWKVISGPATITSGSNTSAITWNAGDAGTANFSVTVTDSNGCTATCYKEVTVYELPDCAITADPGVCVESTGNSANTTSGYASYSWKVVSGPATITSGSNTSAIKWNAGLPGTVNFSVTVTDSNGCTATCYKEVAVYELPDCTITADPGVCAESTGNFANTTSGYASYSWKVVSGPATITSGSNTSAITWNAGNAGTANFSVTVTDSNGCTATCYKEVVIYRLPDCTITADPGVCAESTGNSANTTSGYAEYSWKVVSGPATITSGSNTSAITWNAGDAGTANFSVTVTDSNGCSATCYKEVTVYELPDCTITSDGSVCAYSEGNTANTTSGYASYSWKIVSGPAVITSGSNSDTITWNALGPGSVNFSVSVTDSNGCNNTCFKDPVTVYDLPDCTITAKSGVCAYSEGNSANTTSGYASYSWSVVSGPAIITSGSNSSAITWSAGGKGTVNISVTVIDRGDCTNTCYKEIEVYDLPDCAITAYDVCAYSEGNTASTISGYASYLWLIVSGPGTITSDTNSSSVTWNAGGPGTVNFSVTVTDENGCSAACNKVVTVYQNPTVDAGPDRYIYGFDSSVILSPNVTGGMPEYNYIWTDQGVIINKDGAENVSVSSPGTYVINVTDENGCSDTDSVKVIEVVPDIMVTKTASPSSGSPCTNVTFTITVTNTGEVDLDLEVTDTIPAGMTYVSSNPAPDSVVENANGTWTVVWQSNLEVLGPGNSTQILLVAHIDEDIMAAAGDNVLTTLSISEDETLRIQQASAVSSEKIQELEWMRVRLEIELKKMIELRDRFDKDAADLVVETIPSLEGTGYTVSNYTNHLTGERVVLFMNSEGRIEISEYTNPAMAAVLKSEYGTKGVLISDSYLSLDATEGLRIDYDTPYSGYKIYTLTNYETGDTLIDTFDARGNLVNREYRRTPGIPREIVFTVENCVTAVGTYEAGQVSDTACAEVTVIYRSDLKLTKTPSPTTATVGTSILYTYLVENTGNTTISNLTLFDDMLNKFVSLNRTVLKPGEFAEGTAIYTVVSEDLPGPIVNNATVKGTDPHGAEVKDIDSATVPLYYSKISLIKTPDKTVVGVGDLITYTYLVTNVGTTTINNLTLFDDKINQYLNLSKTTLAPNETATATGEYIALPEDLPGPILNNATVEGTDEKDTPVSAEDDASVDINQFPPTVVKVANRTLVRPGEEVAYTITLRNFSSCSQVNVNDTFNRDVEFVSADPSPDFIGDRWQMWILHNIGNFSEITLVVRTLKPQNFTFDMEQGVEGVGFVNVANDYRTAPPSYILINTVVATCEDDPIQTARDTENVLVRELGTELETREHGSGTYESDELIRMRTENKSIKMDKDMAATYSTTTLGLYNNRSVTYSSKWTEDAKAKNWITGASLTETYRYADFIDRESRFDLDENGSVMEFETEFSGMGHFGALKKADPNDTARDTPTFELNENYVGTFRIYEKVDEYGKNVDYESSTSGEGSVAGDRRVGDSQRSYEHGSGSYDSEGLISTVTNYMAKDISLVYAPTSQNLTDDVSVDSNVKWKEGMYSKSRGISYIGEEYTSIDRLEKESIFRGLNDLATESDFSGTARYRVMLGDISGNDTDNLTSTGPSGAMIDFDEIYSGDYSIAKRIVLTGVPKYDRPHISVVKTANTESGSSLLEYAITVTNDGNVALDTITVEDRLPQGTEFISSSLRPDPDKTTSDVVVWDNILSLPIGRTVNIDLVLNVTGYSGHLVNVVKATAQHGENVTISASNFSVLDPSWLSCCPSEIFAIKTATVDQVLPNVVTYRLSVQNLADTTVAARIDDDIPSGLKVLGYSAMPSEYDESTGRITWVVTDLAPGELRSIDYLVEAIYDGRYVNVARIDPYTLDGQELSQVTVSSVVDIGPFEGAQVPPGWVPPDWDLEYYSYDCTSGMGCEEIS